MGRVVWTDRLGVVYLPQPQRWNGRSIDRIESKAIKTNELFALLLVVHSRCGTHVIK
jgi:hypothetical protein